MWGFINNSYVYFFFFKEREVMMEVAKILQRGECLYDVFPVLVNQFLTENWTHQTEAVVIYCSW